MTSEAPYPGEDRDAIYIDGVGRIWTFDFVTLRWSSPDLPDTSCNWAGVLAYALDRHGRGTLRQAWGAEREAIEREMFS